MEDSIVRSVNYQEGALSAMELRREIIAKPEMKSAETRNDSQNPCNSYLLCPLLRAGPLAGPSM